MGMHKFNTICAVSEVVSEKFLKSLLSRQRRNGMFPSTFRARSQKFLEMKVNVLGWFPGGLPRGGC